MYLSLSRLSILAALLCWAWAGTPARAEIMIGSTLEWLTCQADVVAVGHIEKIVTSRGPGDVVYDDCTVAVTETIKGVVEDRRLVFCYRDLSKESQARAWMKSEQPLLLFLSLSRDHGPEKRLQNMLVPTSHQSPLSVLDLAAPGKEVLDMRFRVLSDKAVILDTCRKTVKQLTAYWKEHRLEAGAKVEFAHLEVPPDSDAWQSLYAGSGCYLKVPAFLAPQAKKR